MNDVTEQSSLSVSSVGEQFRQARTKLNLSLEDVAKEIALRPVILQHIENNEFVQKNIPSTFMRGYVRSYAKFLRLPESAWQNADFGENQKNDLGKNARSTKAVNQYSSHHRWVGTLTAIVLIVVAGMTGLWWWQNYQQSNAERDNLVQNYVNSSTNETSHSVEPVSATNNTVTPVTTDNSATATNTAENNTAESNAVQINTSTETATETTASTSNTVTANADSQTTPVTTNNETQPSTTAELPVVNADLTNQANAQANTNVANVEDTQGAVENPKISEAVPAAKGDLVIEVTAATSWISVKDKNRKVLAQKEYKQGEVLTFNGDEYAVIIGAPGNVRISYKGEAYPLKIDGRIAKFKLPKP